MKITAVLALTATIALAGCAGYSRVTEYPAHLPKNVSDQVVNGKRFLIKRHPKEPTILIQPTMGRAAFSGLAMGIGSPKMDDYKGAAEAYAAAHNCRVERFTQLESVSYEAKLECPPQ